MSKLFLSSDQELLLSLLCIPTENPLETGYVTDLRKAQMLYAEYAKKLGFEIIYHQSPPKSIIDDPDVPLSVVEMFNQLGEVFLETQPNLVLRVGPAREISKTIMFNFHMDTVKGTPLVKLENNKIFGRGTVDMKGAGVAILAGIRDAINNTPELIKHISIIVQCVSGEEGGAMGIYGTKLLAELGYLGKLNIFAEATNGCYFDHSTASSTVNISICGVDAIDDNPNEGHNATIFLGYLASSLAENMANEIEQCGGKICIAGIKTGEMHNQVYGSGSLKIIFAYNSKMLGNWIEQKFEEAFALECAKFEKNFGSVNIAKKIASEIKNVSSYKWIKKGLPVLNNRHPEMEKIFAIAGIKRISEDELSRTFTCDAIWVNSPNTYTVVFGPGNLVKNGAHTDNEFIKLEELERYSFQISKLVRLFYNRRKQETISI